MNEPMQMIRARTGITGGITRTNSPALRNARYANFAGIFKKQSRFNLIWYTTFIIFGIVSLILFHKNPKVIITVSQLFLYLVVMDLIAKGNVLGVWLNIVDCFFYGAICYMNGVYGEMFRTLIISNAFNVYGIILWGKKNDGSKKSKTDELNVRKLTTKNLVLMLLGLVISTTVAYFILDAVGTTQALLGAMILMSVFFNKLLSMARYKEGWILNLFGSLLSLTMWTIVLVTNVKRSGDWSVFPMIGTYLASFTNNIYGLVLWEKLYKRLRVNGGQYLAMRPIRIKKVIKLKRKFAKMKWIPERDYDPRKAGDPDMERRIALASKRAVYPN